MNLTFMATTTPQTKYGDLYALSWKNYLLRLVQNYATLSRHDWYDVMCIGYKFNLILIINIGSYIYGHIHVWTTVADFHFLMCNHIGWIIGLSNSACSSCRCWVEGRRRLVSRSWEWRCRLRLPRRPCPVEQRASLSWWELTTWVRDYPRWKKGRCNLFIAKVPLFADAHAEHAGIPPLDHLAHAESEVKWLVAINRGVEL